MNRRIGWWLRKRIVIAVVAGALVVMSTHAPAHDVWLGVGAAGADTDPTVKQFFGESYPDGTLFAMDASLITRFDVINEDGTVSLLPAARELHGSRAVPLKSAGRQAALVVVDHGFIEHRMSSEAFHEYVHHEALADAHDHGHRRDHREIYARTLKSYVPGSGSDTARIFRRRAGQALEIILCDDPAALAPGGQFEVQVIYQGRALPYHRVSAIAALGNAARRRQDVVSDANGFARFAVTGTGAWLIRSMHLVPCAEGADCEDVDWQSYWSALTFDVPGGREHPPGSID